MDTSSQGCKNADVEQGSKRRVSGARRPAILNAALDLFLEKGTGPTNVDEIRKRSGASVGGFYHHFQGTFGVAVALFLEILEDYCGGLLAELHKHSGAEARIKAGVRYHLAWVRRNVKSSMYITYSREFEALRASAPRSADALRAFFGQLDAWLKARAQAGVPKRLPFEIAFAPWLAPVEVFARYWVLGPRDEKQIRAAQAILAKTA